MNEMMLKHGFSNSIVRDSWLTMHKPIGTLSELFMVSSTPPSRCTSRNWPKCNHSICDYMRLLVICNYIWTFLQLFLVLVIFATIMQLVCNYFSVHHSMWITFNLVFIQEEQFMSHSCKCDPFSYNPNNISIWSLIKIFK